MQGAGSQDVGEMAGSVLKSLHFQHSSLLLYPLDKNSYKAMQEEENVYKYM